MLNTLEVEPQKWNWNENTGLALAIFGLIIEMISDSQKSTWHCRHADRPDRYSRSPPVCASGMWYLSRHPNHFGDLCLQWGVWMMVTDVTPLASIVGPVICTLIVFVSDGGMRLIETERELQYFTYDAYRDYKEKTSLFWPVLPAIYSRLPRFIKRCLFLSEIYD
jgi:steroid 5-alpha reductase family enzyme